MELTPLLFWTVAAVAALYAAVGHGGASGHLAIMALLSVPPSTAKPAALMLNLLVAGIAFLQFRGAGHFRASRLWPLALASIPCSYLGALVRVPPNVYAGLLAFSLAAAALRLALPARADGAPRPFPGARVTLPVGAGLGLLSGVVGVGGGIFLSPLLILARWADPKVGAAVSAAFIWLNSLAGLAGRWSAAGDALPGALPWAAAAVMGGAAGALLGARRLPSPALRRALAAVLLMAAGKLAL